MAKYVIHKDGSVYNFNTRRKLKPGLMKGYHIVTFYNNKRRKSHLVHRLVAKAYIPNPNNSPEVNHIDGNKLNNHMDNLEWVTHAENMKHAGESGLM